MDTEFTEYLAVDPLDVIVAAYCREKGQAIEPNVRLTFPGCTPTDYSGNELTRSPKLQYSIGVEYEFYLGRFGTLTPRVQYYWQDDTWYRPFNRTQANSGPNSPCPIPGGNMGGCRDGILQDAADGRDLQESYHLTDIKLIWTSPTSSWTAEAFVQNLEDKVVYQNVLVSTPLLDSPQFAWLRSPARLRIPHRLPLLRATMVRVLAAAAVFLLAAPHGWSQTEDEDSTREQLPSA